MLHVSYADAELPAWGCTYCGEDNLGIETFCDNCHEYNDVVSLLGYVSGRAYYTDTLRGLGAILSDELLGRQGWTVTADHLREVLQFEYRLRGDTLVYTFVVASSEICDFGNTMIYEMMIRVESLVHPY